MISLLSFDVGAHSRRSEDQSSGSATGPTRASRSNSRGASASRSNSAGASTTSSAAAPAVGDDSEIDSAGRKPCPKCGKRYNVSLWFERHYRDCKGTGKALFIYAQTALFCK